MCSLRAEEGGIPPKRQFSHIEHGTPAREGGEPLNQEEEDRAPPEQRALPEHGMQERGEAPTPNSEDTNGVPPEQHVIPEHSMQERGAVGGTPYQEGEGGQPPEQERTPFVLGLIQEMRDNPQDLQRTHTSRQSGAEGAGEEGRESKGVREGAPLPLGGRETPEEQARVIFDNIGNTPPGRISSRGQSPVHHIRRTCPTREGRVRRGRDWRGGGRGGAGGEAWDDKISEPPLKRGGSPRGDGAWRGDVAGRGGRGAR